MRQPHMLRQRDIGCFVSQIVTDVGEKCPFRLQSVNDLHRIFDRRVRGMRFVPKGIQKQNVEVFQLPQGRIRNLAVIGQIRC